MIPHVGVHQTASVIMGDRIVKCVNTLPNDNKGEIHQMESIENVNWIVKVKEPTLTSENEIFMYMLKSHKLNCCIEDACCDIVNDLEIESMRK